MKLNLPALGVALILMCACTATGQMSPMNQQATNLGVPKFEFVRQGMPFGPVTITMPDGEVLNGRYQVIQNGAITFGSASAFGTGGSAFASGSSFMMGGASPVLISASGARGTVMNCQGSVSFGHGGGVCETSSGARYQVMF